MPHGDTGVNAKAAHWEAVRQDIRDEIKRRIEQRDKFSYQMAPGLGAVFGLSFSSDSLRKVLIAAPLIAVYFTALILYSYEVHKVLARYLREVVENRLPQILGTQSEDEWEIWYVSLGKQIPGIRSSFFKWVQWLILGITILVLYFDLKPGDPFRPALFVVAIAYALPMVYVTFCIGGEAPSETGHK
jgi:hypothetical protein